MVATHTVSGHLNNFIHISVTVPQMRHADCCSVYWYPMRTYCVHVLLCNICCERCYYYQNSPHKNKLETVLFLLRYVLRLYLLNKWRLVLTSDVLSAGRRISVHFALFTVKSSKARLTVIVLPVSCLSTFSDEVKWLQSVEQIRTLQFKLGWTQINDYCWFRSVTVTVN